MKKPQNPVQKIRPYVAFLARPAILFYTLPWLMVLLIIGTIAQKDIGIYAAHELYFSSWILWLGFIPLPGGYPTLAAISLCLLAKFLFFSPWHAKKAGIYITHFGILVLMIGGLLTAMTQREGFIMLREGMEASQISDYHTRALIIQRDGQDWQTIPFTDIASQQPFPVSLPFDIEVLETCQNCKPNMTENPDGRKGFAQKVELLPIENEKENEANLSGFTFSVSNVPDDQSGVYIAVEEIPIYPSITKDGVEYSFIMGRSVSELPFSIALNNFEKEYHPGTNMAKSYVSEVTITDNGVEWDSTIQMNQPLRYKGYTFYQSSFAIRPDGEFSILSVVQNKGRVFPYIASAIIFIGLLLHLILKSNERKRA